VLASGLSNFADRREVNRALARLAATGRLIRVERGVYVSPVVGRFGVRSPNIEMTVKALAALRGEIVTSTGASAANALGLTTQVPVRSIYLTSGRGRMLNFGGRAVELKHAPRWQLEFGDCQTGDAVRALAWLGPQEAVAAMLILGRRMSPASLSELAAAAPMLPGWLARTVLDRT